MCRENCLRMTTLLNVCRRRLRLGTDIGTTSRIDWPQKHHDSTTKSNVSLHYRHLDPLSLSLWDPVLRSRSCLKYPVCVLNVDKYSFLGTRNGTPFPSPYNLEISDSYKIQKSQTLLKSRRKNHLGSVTEYIFLSRRMILPVFVSPRLHPHSVVL